MTFIFICLLLAWYGIVVAVFVARVSLSLSLSLHSLRWLFFAFNLNWNECVLLLWDEFVHHELNVGHQRSSTRSRHAFALFCSNRFLFVPYTSFLLRCSLSLFLLFFLLFSETTAKTTTTTTTMTVMNSNSIFCWMSKYLFILFRYFIVSFFKSVCAVRFQQFQVNLN